MKNKLALLFAPWMLWATTATAQPTWAMPEWRDWNWGVTPFFGADAVWRHMDFWAGNGENAFKHNAPQGDVYTGFKFCDYFGVQFGYEATSRKNKTVTLNLPYIISGVMVTSARGLTRNAQIVSTHRIKGPHVDLVGYLPICDRYRLALTGSVGIAHLKLSAQYRYTAFNGVANFNIPPLVFTGRKTVARLMGGISHQITDCVGVRASVTWEHTAKLRLHHVTRQRIVHTIRPKDSVNYGLGLYILF